MKSHQTYSSVDSSVQARVPSSFKRIRGIGRGTGMLGIPDSRFLGLASPALGAVSLRVAPGLLGTQVLPVTTPG